MNRQNYPSGLSVLDINISAGGIILYELASCGVPTIAIKVADNQILLVNELESRGIVISLDSGNKNFEKELTKDIMFLINNKDRRRVMADNAINLTDSKAILRTKNHRRRQK